VIDLYGMRAVISAIAPMILIIVHLMLGFSSVGPIGPLVGQVKQPYLLFSPSLIHISQGLAYTGFVSVLWPAVPLVVEEKVVGLAFGIVTSMQNLVTFSLLLLPISNELIPGRAVRSSRSLWRRSTVTLTTTTSPMWSCSSPPWVS
jgi:hypothetical protein